MAWFAAHLIQYAKFLDGNQDYYWIWENVILIEAGDGQVAWDEARRIGRETYDDQPDGRSGIRIDERPALMAFAGVRKVIECENMTGNGPDRTDADFRPAHGTEVTYSQLRIESAETFANYVDGEAASVLYEE